MTPRAMMVRLGDDRAEALETVAAVDGVPVAEAIRVAVDAHIASRRADPEFRRRLREHLDRVRATGAAILGED